jgi:superfamily II DNA or RNA helicase
MDLRIIKNVAEKKEYGQLINMTKNNRNLCVKLASVAMRKEDLEDSYKKIAMEFLKVLNSEKECIHRSKTVLTPIQVKTVEHFDNTDSMLIVFGTGLGKTLTALSASQCFLDENPNSSVIIISPASLLNNFKKEMRKYGGENIEKYEFYSFEKVMNAFKQEVSIKGRNALLIIDEVHNLKNYNGIKFDSIMNLAKNTKKRLLLTATPIVNDYKDIISIINLLEGEYVLQTKKIGDEAIRKFIDKGKYVPVLKRIDTDHQWGLRAGKFDRNLEGVQDLTIAQLLEKDIVPELVDHIEDKLSIFLNGRVAYMNKEPNDDFPTFDTKFEYIRMSQEYQQKFDDILDSIDEDRLFKEPSVFYNGYRRVVNATSDTYFSEKMKRIVKIIKKNRSHQSVIYSSWIDFGVNKLMKILSDNQISYGIVEGSCSIIERDTAVKAFNSKEIDVLVITKAGCEGLDLKEVRNIFVLDPPWNPAGLEQIIGRGIRYRSHANLPKEERHVNIYYLMLIESYYNEKIIERDGYDGRSGDYILYKIIFNKKYKIDSFNEFLKRITIKYTETDKKASSPNFDQLGIARVNINPQHKYKTYKKRRFHYVEIGNYIFSTATPLEVLKTGLNSHDDYFLGLLYEDGDIQIGITGTKYHREDVISALNRELCEETGLYLDQPHDLPELKNRTINHKDWTFTEYPINIRDTVLGCNNKYEGSDNKEQKVGLMITGSLDEFEQKYATVLDERTINNILKNREKDNIVGYRFIHKKDLRLIIDAMEDIKRRQLENRRQLEIQRGGQSNRNRLGQANRNELGQANRNGLGQANLFGPNRNGLGQANRNGLGQANLFGPNRNRLGQANPFGPNRNGGW